MRNKNLILNYVFIVGILILLINDQWLKFSFPGLVTGKLSDSCGIIIFPLLLTYVFPRLKDNSVWIAVILFAFWKSEYSQSLIDLYNRFSPIETSRVIDYTDLSVFVLIPIPYFLLKKEELIHLLSIKVNEYVILLPSILIFIATSPPQDHYYMLNNGNLKCFRCTININQSAEEVISRLGKNGIVFDSIKPIEIRGVIDSVSGAKKLIKRQLILGKDTLKNVDVTLVPVKENRTKLYFNGMDVDRNLSDAKLKRALRRYYKTLVLSEIKSQF